MIADRKRWSNQKIWKIRVKKHNFFSCWYILSSTRLIYKLGIQKQNRPINAATNFLPSETGAISYIVLQTQHDINNYVRHQKKNVYKYIV